MFAFRWSLVLSSLTFVACSVGTNPPSGRDGDVQPGEDGGPIATHDSGPRRDAGRRNPFDPDSACGAATIPTERVPGQLLLVFDRSGSMDEPPSGDSGPTKWDMAKAAINTAFSRVGDDLSAGLLLFPAGSGSSCSVAPSDVTVPVAPLATSRAAIQSALASASPSGSTTPMFGAMRAGWDVLDTLSGPGQRGLVVVTDGAVNCDTDDRSAVLAQVATELADNHYLTFAVGLNQSNNDLSTIAYNGGTPRNATCLPECTAGYCETSADCMGAATCEEVVPGFEFEGVVIPPVMMCSCTGDGDCVAPQTCQTCPLPGTPLCDFLPPPMCGGDSNCCHYDASGSSFQADFEQALDEIARRFLESCVFDVPRGDDPSMFDPNLVNVGVTFEGEERTVLPQSSDSATDSWNYVDPSHESIIIQGPICERLLMSAGEVEIVLGCPTILI